VFKSNLLLIIVAICHLRYCQSRVEVVRQYFCGVCDFSGLKVSESSV